jgi:hypothetical protein
MAGASMPYDNPLFTLIDDLVNQVRANWGEVHKIEGALGTHFVEYTSAEDSEDGEQYADIALMFPDEVFAVIDGDTYGTLFSIRIYQSEVE